MSLWSSRRYRWSGPVYDLLSAEPVYCRGRRAGIEQLRLRPGSVVLDLGCGTGLSFPLLQRLIGPDGLIVGVDASAGMLAAARRRCRAAGWQNVELVCSDAAELDPEQVRGRTPGRAGVDAVLAVYALSVIGSWRPAWAAARAAAAPRARLVVVDLGLPAGAAGWLAPLARLACAAGGSDPGLDPGPQALTGTTLRTRAELLAGHVRVDAGTLPGQDRC